MSGNALRQFELYQGRDWTSFRLSVAQVFETLDQMQDFCPPMSSPGEEDMGECLTALRELNDGLSGEIDSMLADILPQVYQAAVVNQMQHTPARWAAVEVRHHLDAARKLLTELARPATTAARREAGLFAASELIGKMKELVRHIDSV